MKTKKEPIVPKNVWTCLTCTPNVELDHKPMMEHMQTVHGINTKTAKGSESMLMHIDGADYFSSRYEVTVGEFKFLQFTLNPRRKWALERRASEPHAIH